MSFAPALGKDFETQVKIGGQTLKFSQPQCEGDKCEITWIGDYISAIFSYGVGLAAVLAVIMIMVGGFLWLTSGGSPDRVGKAKEFISSALLGLVLALLSFVILYTVNPRLVALESIGVSKVGGGSTTASTGGAAAWTGGGSTAGLPDGVTIKPGVNTNGLSSRLLERLAALDQAVNGPIIISDAIDSRWRHASGYVLDMSFDSESALADYVYSNTISIENLSWGRACHLPDGTVFVLEPDSMSPEGRHWHVEFCDGPGDSRAWPWRPNG